MEVFLIIVWLYFGIASAKLAYDKGRSVCGWLIIGLLLGPLGFAVALLPKLEKVKIKIGQEMHLLWPRYCAVCGNQATHSANASITTSDDLRYHVVAIRWTNRTYTISYPVCRKHKYLVSTSILKPIRVLKVKEDSMIMSISTKNYQFFKDFKLLNMDKILE